METTQLLTAEALKGRALGALCELPAAKEAAGRPSTLLRAVPSTPELARLYEAMLAIGTQLRLSSSAEPLPAPHGFFHVAIDAPGCGRSEGSADTLQASSAASPRRDLAGPPPSPPMCPRLSGTLPARRVVTRAPRHRALRRRAPPISSPKWSSASARSTPLPSSPPAPPRPPSSAPSPMRRSSPTSSSCASPPPTPRASRRTSRSCSPPSSSPTAPRPVQAAHGHSGWRLQG